MIRKDSSRTKFSWHFEWLRFIDEKSKTSFSQNGSSQKDSEMKWTYKKRSKDSFLMFCEIVLQHERELLSEVSFCIIFLFIFVSWKYQIHEIFHFPHAAIAINRHSTHHRRQLTKIEPRKGEVSSRSKIQPSIRTPMAEQMEKLQLTQTVSPCPSVVREIFASEMPKILSL